MKEKFNAVCIRSTQYRDNDKMLSLFSLEKGVVDCVVRGVRSPKSKLRFASELFCFAEYVVDERNGKKTVVEANEIDSFFNIRADIGKYYSALAVLEFIRLTMLESIKSYETFSLFIKTLKVIEEGEHPKLALISFYLSALKELGVGINLGRCEGCKSAIEGKVFFELDTSSFFCENCKSVTSFEMRIATFNLLNEVFSHPIEIFKNSDLSTYSPTFLDENSIFFAIKFLDYYIEEKLDIVVKTNLSILEMFSNL